MIASNCKSGPGMIFVVDDDPQELYGMSRILKKAGYAVEEFVSGQEALAKAEQFMPDILLLDVVMPVMDGFEVCRRFKAHEQLKEIFVILVSSLKKTPEYQAKGLDAGADGFITRPFSSVEFVARIRSMMRIKTVEKELRIKQQWLRVSLSSMGDGLIAIDDKEQILFMNQVAEDLTGWTDEQAKHKNIQTIFKIFDSITSQSIDCPIGKVLKHGQMIQLDDTVVLIDKNNKRVPIADSAAPIRNTLGEIIGGILVFRDITEKKRDREKLIQALKNWEAMFNSMNQMSLIIDPHHGIQDVNNAALRLTGLTREEIIGKKCFEIIHGAVQPPEKCPMVRALKSGIQESSSMVLEKLEGDFLVSCTPVLDTKGDIEKIIHIATDITQLKKTEADLKLSEQKYRTLFKSSSDAIFLVDVQTLNILDANEVASTLYGYGHKEFLELKALDLSSEKDKTTQVLTVDQLTQIPIRYHQKKDGTVFPVEITANYLMIDGREVNLSSIRDISSRLDTERERKALEKHLQQSQKLESIGTLAAGIAHDFNNILSSVMGYTELSFDLAEKGTELEGNLHQVYSAATRAKELVKEILTFARKTEENVMPVLIGPIIQEVCKFLRSSVPTTIDISYTINSDSFISADATKIHQILMNLSTNAVQAMEDTGGKLDLCLSVETIKENTIQLCPEIKTGVYLRLTVSDTGSGIPKQIMKNIFDPYFSTKAPGEGTGLGLAMVHGIVKNYGGHITVISEIGKGTVFNLYFPITDQQSSEKQSQSENLAAGGDERILFVDDELPITRMAGQMLESLGYNVTARNSSMEALELFHSRPDDYDMLITDMTMPIMTGDKLAIEILKIRPDFPILLCTGYNKKISFETAKQIGIKAFITKPIAKADLAKIVRKVLDESKIDTLD